MKQKPSFIHYWRVKIFHSPLSHYLWGVLLTAATTGLGFLVSVDISPTNLVMIYLLAVVIAAVYLGRGPSILVAFLSVLAFDFFFVPPKLTLSVADTEYIITFTSLFLVGVVISALTVRAREEAESARRREADTAALYALSRDLAAADGPDSVIKAIRKHISPEVGRDVIVYLSEGDSLHPHADLPLPVSDGKEFNAALDVFQRADSNWHHSNEAYYIPLQTSQRVIGVVSIKPRASEPEMTPDQLRLLEAFASQTAQAIERVQLAEQTRQIKLLQATEKLQNALLNSISHDLRTPLVSITGALTTLEEQSDSLDPLARQSLVETAREEADRLNWLVGDLLEMSRLESGALKVRREPSDVQDVIGTAIGQMDERLRGHSLRVDVPDDFPLVALDFVLIIHVINNLLDNAIKYSATGSPLEVRASLVDSEAHISILDRGFGIPASDLERVFDKFYRVQRPEQVTGTGLGLAICKGIVEAHGGRIWAANRPEGGTIMTIALPIAEPK
jgi:two-component system, OmpR family, sensor histidine kinase KdpD